ncbi:hypothetical protein GF406_26540 [candidate division KSB1 bacterium]|nr:hypothetical protein [candidate division KSB1 bacterium]
MKRREFVATLGAACISAVSYQNIYGANDRLGMALVGTGRRGRNVMGEMIKTGRAEMRCLCDIWDVQRQRAKEELGIQTIAETIAIEEALSRPDVDAVLIATPDHLHKDYAVQTLQAGKHLYLEKPVTRYLNEGKAIQEAVQNSGLICQTGTQQRSASHYKKAKELYFSGSDLLGDIVFVRSVWSDFGWQRRKIEPRPKPDHFDWQRFLGPAPDVPYDWARYDAWRNYKDYGAGILSDLLTHWADVAQWMLDDPNPINAVTTGGIYYLKDGRTNPDTVNTIIKYHNGINLTFECTIMPIETKRASVLFHGTKGKLEIYRRGYTFTPHDGKPQVVERTQDLNREHVNDFFDAIKHNRQPSANIDIGLQAVRPSHLAVAAYWTGKRMTFNKEFSKIIEQT